MIKEALSYLVDLGQTKKDVEKLTFGGRHYTDRQIHKLEEPTVTPIHRTHSWQRWS